MKSDFGRGVLQTLADHLSHPDSGRGRVQLKYSRRRRNVGLEPRVAAVPVHERQDVVTVPTAVLIDPTLPLRTGRTEGRYGGSSWERGVGVRDLYWG